MHNSYLGKLDYSDPLYEILRFRIYNNITAPLFHVNRMSSRRVYKYTEEKTRLAVVGKFFMLDDQKQERVLRIKGEFNNLQLIRSYGFDSFPNYVVRPIDKEERIGLALLEEFMHGKDLDYYLKMAIYNGDVISLKKRLDDLALFLYSLHAKTMTDNYVNLDDVSSYFQKVLKKLCNQEVISKEKKTYLKLMDKWLKRDGMSNAKSVIVHGDATPTNFIFTEEGGVVAIDLERIKNADQVFDIGMICGELKHAFLWRTGNPYNSESLIRYFLKSYCNFFKNSERAFKEITHRNPFYMALTELRIARNTYLDWNYKKRLAYEALKCMKWGLKI